MDWLFLAFSWKSDVMMGKTFDFVITLKKKENNWVDPTNGILLLLASICFLYQCMMVLRTGYNENLLVFYIGYPIFSLAWCIFCYVRIKKGQPAFFRIGLLVSASGFFYLLSDLKYVSVLYIMASLMEKPLKSPFEIGFDDKEIVFNSFPSKKTSWAKMNNVILKDGLLTLDYKSNNLFQMYTNEETSTELEKEFNEFCKNNLVK